MTAEKQSDLKMGGIDIFFPKKTSKWLSDTWKDAQHRKSSGKHK